MLAVVPLESPPAWLESMPLLPGLHRRWSTLRMMAESRSIIKYLQPDIVQVNTTKWPWVLAVFSPPGVHVTYDIRQINEAVSPGFLARLREKQVVRSWSFWSRIAFEHTFFCHSEAAKRVLGEGWPKYASVIPVGVDDRFLELDDSEICIPDEDESVRLVYVGTLSRLRNLEQLFYAAALLHTETDNFHLTFVGTDQSGGFFQQKINELGLAEFVTISPALHYDQVPEFLAHYHVGLAYVPDRPTWHYQPTIKVLEYRALGLPILSTDVLSHRGLVQDGINGVMVDDTPESVAAGMRRLVVDRHFLQELMDNARQMRQGLTWDNVAHEYEIAYQSLSASLIAGERQAREPSSSQAVFIVGYLHSGTTLLQQILNRHPLLFVGSGETRFFDAIPLIQAQYPDIRQDAAFADFAVFMTELVQVGYDHVVYDEKGPSPGIIHPLQKKLWRTSPGFDQEARLQNDRLAFFPIVAAYVAQRLDKLGSVETPTHLFHIPKILDVVPEALFLEMVRDPRAILASKRKRLGRGGNYDPIWDNLAWKSAVRTTENLPPEMAERVLRIRYQDLVSSPETEVKRVCAFLQIPFLPQMLEVGWVNSTTAQSAGSSGISTAAISSWEKGLDPESIVVTQFLTRPEMARLGYEAKAMPARAWARVPFMIFRSGGDILVRLSKRWRQEGFAGLSSNLKNYWLRVVGLSK